MTAGNIETNKPRLDRVLREINSGEIQLPDFQRDWVWGDRQIKSLLASVSLGIPIGTLLTTEADDRLSHRPFVGVDSTNMTPAKTLVLDGQQRLTSLFQACLSGRPVETGNKKTTTERWYYFKMQKCVDREEDREECVISETANQPKYSNSPENQYEDEIFPAGMLFSYRQWRDGYLKFHGYDELKRELADRFEDLVVRNFDRYEVPEVRMSNVELETIVITFEKTNDRGKRLDAFDIITAKMKREGLDMREDWRQQENALSAEPVLEKVSETHYLKAITLLATDAGPTRISARRKDILNLSRKEYETYRDGVTQGFIQAATLLKELGINRAKDLVHVPQAIVLAAVYAHADRSQTDTISARAIFERWYWTTLLNESYGGRTTDEQLANDFSELIHRLNSLRSEQTLPFAGRLFNSDRLRLGSQNGLAVAVQSLITRNNNPLDWMKGSQIRAMAENAVNRHHVFPKKWCKDNGIEDGERDSVANIALVDAETNKIIGKKAPSVYLKELQAKAGNISNEQMDRILESHLIPVAEIRQDDFKAFHEKRAALLKDVIAKAIGLDMVK